MTFQDSLHLLEVSSDSDRPYLSPLAAIPAEIRRTNKTPIVIDYSSREDSWNAPCECTTTTTTTITTQSRSSFTATTTCLLCGRNKSGIPTSRTNSTESTTNTSTTIGEHAHALLEATPQLRILHHRNNNNADDTKARNLWQLLGRDSERSELLLLMPTIDHDADYHFSLVRDRANQLAAAELASFLWVLAHEMSLEDYGTVESNVFSAVFTLVHSSNNKHHRMAGLAALDALLEAPSADEERKAIKFANTLSNGLRASHTGDYEFLSAVARALGHMAEKTANVDFVESEVTRGLEWLRMEPARSDRRYAV